MAKARVIISDALTFGLNRLSPGETLDADTAQRCLDALNNIVDRLNGQNTFLFCDVFTSGVVNGVTGTLGVTWPGVRPGEQIEGVTATYSTNNDVPLSMMTMDVYANIVNKSTAGFPSSYSPDGFALIYFWPACTGQTITLRTRQNVNDFADLDTDYGMPDGCRADLADMLAEKMAPTMAPEMLSKVAADAVSARRRAYARTISPDIMQPAGQRGNILNGWR